MTLTIVRGAEIEPGDVLVSRLDAAVHFSAIVTSVSPDLNSDQLWLEMIVWWPVNGSFRCIEYGVLPDAKLCADRHMR